MFAKHILDPEKMLRNPVNLILNAHFAPFFFTHVNSDVSSAKMTGTATISPKQEAEAGQRRSSTPREQAGRTYAKLRSYQRSARGDPW